MPKSEDDMVGYGRPPRSGQYEKGRSGNPRGRPKKAASPSAQFWEAANERISGNVNGQRVTVSRLKAAFIRQLNKAVEGDSKAFKAIVDLIFKLGLPEMPLMRADAIELTPETIALIAKEFDKKY